MSQVIAIEVEKHIKFLLGTAKSRGFEWVMSEYLRMSGIYWSLTALCLLDAQDKLPKDDLVLFVKSCLNPSGGFSPAPGHYPSVIYTLSVWYVTILLWIHSGRTSDNRKPTPPNHTRGSRKLNIWTYLWKAIQILKILNELDSFAEVDQVVSFIASLQNEDGSFKGRRITLTLSQ